MKKGAKVQGFTIIEVMLVLAVAGLIFLGVFMAVTTLNRQARDTERREDMVKLVSAIKKFQTNNRGSLPTKTGNGAETGIVYSDTAGKATWAGFYRDYLGSDFEDPSKGSYVLNVDECGSKAGEECAKTKSGGALNVADKDFPNGQNVSIITGAVCDGEAAIGSTNPRRVAVLYKLERLGTYCGNS